MAYFKRQLSITSVTRKVIAGFLLVFVAISLALGIAHFGFREMLGTVEQLSAPNEKLSALNTIFQEITALDQTQRAEALKNPKSPYSVYLNQSKSFVNKLDSLRLLDWDSTQRIKLLEIKGILQKRNRLFLSYMKLKSDLIDNRKLTQRLDTLSKMLVNERVAFDTSVVTTEKKTITTYTQDSVREEKGRKWKLFNKKKNVPAPTTHVKVEEQLSVVVDTVSVARQNKALAEVENIILGLEKDQRAENKRLLTEELALIHANSLFISQLLGILHDVEADEVAQMHANSDRAAQLVTQSIWRISLLLIIFFLGAALLVYLIWLDVTRSNYYKLQLEKARDEAEELSQIKQRFLANMSHEIRTPLQSIIGFAEQLKQDKEANAEAVAAINTSSEHLLHIVNEVLDYSRISSGSFVLSKESFDLLPLVKDVAAALTIQAKRKGLSLILDVEFASDITLKGDPFRLRQILYNLLGNAVKFTSKGSVKLNVRTSDQGNFTVCTFEVKDTGIGIRQEDINRIFNQFEQANTSITKQYGGTGLGLTIAKSLIEAQQGSLKVSSEPGQGSVFTVSIPFETSTKSETKLQLQAPEDNTEFNGKVLVVDDDLMILRLCSVVLAKYGIRYTTFNDARQLLHEEMDRDVTHILMDIRMPEINGIELCHALREVYPVTTQFIALTAHVFPQEHQELLKEGFDMVMLKPFREQELISLFGLTSAATPEVSSDVEMDLTVLKMMTQGDEALLQSILIQFVDETESDIDMVKSYLKDNKREAVREIVHKLAGRTGQMGSISVSNMLREIENHLAAGNHLTSVAPALERAVNKVENLLRTIRIQTPA